METICRTTGRKMTEALIWKKLSLYMECPHCKAQSPILGEVPKDIWKLIIKLKLAQQVEQEK